MKAKSISEAWKIADEIFPADYEKDENLSIRAGYPIYTSNADCEDHISDLGNRLELNIGYRSVNIWIEEEPEEEKLIKEVVKATAIVKESFIPRALFEPEEAIKVTIIVEGYSWSSDEEKEVYKALGNEYSAGLQFDIIEKYCLVNNIPWKSISNTIATHYGKIDSGHYIVTGYVKRR